MNSLNILSARVSPPQTPAPSRTNSYGNVLASAGVIGSRRNSREDTSDEKIRELVDTTEIENEDDPSIHEETPLLGIGDRGGIDPKLSGWQLISLRIIHSIRWTLSTLAVPGVYLMAYLYDDRGHFAPLTQIRKFGGILLGGSRITSTAHSVGSSSKNESSRVESYDIGTWDSTRRGLTKGSKNANSSSSGMSSESESDFDPSLSEKDNFTSSRHARSKSLQGPDEIAPARRSIRIKLHNEDSMRQRKHRKTQSASTQSNGSGAIPSGEISPATLKSPTSPAASLLMTKYPRAPAPPRPLIPRRRPSYTLLDTPNGRPTQKTLILDLDETLIHSMAKGGRMSTGHMVEVKLNTFVGASGNATIGPQHPILYYVHKRPHCDDFLRRVCKWYNLVVFTASVQEYADPVIDWLEQERKFFSGRYYRQHCTYRNGAFIKDLSSVEPDLSKVMILDNSPLSYMFHQDNAIPIEGWINDPTDNDLLHLVPLLEGLQPTPTHTRGRQCCTVTMPLLSVSGGESVKAQVIDHIPKRFKELKFGIQSNQDIVSQAVLEVSDRMLYDVEKMRRPVPHGALDSRLGISSKTGFCETCGEGLRNCNGHFGHNCARILLTETDRREYLKDLRRPGIDNLKRTQISLEDLNPLRVLNLFKMIPPTDCELLGLNPAEGRPEMFLWQFVPAPPICIRPSVAQDNASTEDDLTTKLADIVHISSLIRSALQKGQPVQTIMDQWEYLQLQIAMYVNSDVPGLQQQGYGKPIRGFCQRLKGKQGRFRGNLSGKRVDFSGRTVISPDPNLSIEQVAIPMLVAKNLTYPERVQSQNIRKLRQCVDNGPSKHPGAVQIIKKDSDHKISLQFANKEKEANNLRFGDVVERHLEDGDIVLFNRQPSLHKLSIMSHYVKVRPWRTFRLNECVCTPYNADFDGDEMNLHVPQTEEARTEAINLMGVQHNLSTPKNGEPIISATQDFITAAYLLSSKESFFDRKTFTHLCMYMVDGNLHLDLPPPAIVKPQTLWTGKQIFSVLMRPNKESKVLVNLDARCRDYKAPGIPPKNDDSEDGKKANGPKEAEDPKYRFKRPDMCEYDGWLVIRNSEVMCGRMDKTTIGSGKKDSIFYIILRDFGPEEAVKAMNRLSKISARYLTNQGFSIGISDVYPSQELVNKKNQLVAMAYRGCEKSIKEYTNGELKKSAGCNMEESLESAMSGLLSKVRQDAGNYCIDNLNKWNSPLIMARSGSKGSSLNVAQMVAVVGQQIIGGQRVPDGFQDRTLPHYPKHARLPPSKGFVKNSFFSGLTPTEFLFHAISGREGLVDTAVKTAETGYMSRRLMKSLEDLSTQYDDTVRTSSGGIVQFQFGADKLDPLYMEGSAVPVYFDRTWTHAENITWDNGEASLDAKDVRELCEKNLSEKEKQLERVGLLGEKFSYVCEKPESVDEKEGARNFIKTVRTYIYGLARKIETAQNIASKAWNTDNTQDARQAKDTIRKSLPKPPINEGTYTEHRRDRVAKVTSSALKQFLFLCFDKYEKALVEPGHAVGAVGAQSIGEPGTQMTLKTFHFAGVAGMSMTQGVPRIKEIINASKIISTPIITCQLKSDNMLVAAHMVKARIEKTFISDVIRFIEDLWSAKRATLCLSVDTKVLSEMYLGVSIEDIALTICRNKKLKIRPGDVTTVGESIFINVTHESSGSSGGRSNGGTKSKVSIDEGGSDLLLRVNYLKRTLPTVVISGYPDATRAIIQISNQDPNLSERDGKSLDDDEIPLDGIQQPVDNDRGSRDQGQKHVGKTSQAVVENQQSLNKISELLGGKNHLSDKDPKVEPAENIGTRGGKKYTVLVEGYGLRACMTTEGVVGTKTITNSVVECREVLGIEAARTTIAKETAEVMKGMEIDPRHMELLADVMTYKGEILGITRFGLSKMRDSVLMLASFEKTPDHLFEAAAGMKSDKIEGVSECIIMGQTMSVGTGAFKIITALKLKEGDVKQKPTSFEDAWKWDQAERKKELK
ncbi:hypothetical protein B7494_g7938 [Chlorociboria aeruginascens]|nr:hypothetical protein B7494_g7938 [Chlorociboria aeruginascens]